MTWTKKIIPFLTLSLWFAVCTPANFVYGVEPGGSRSNSKAGLRTAKTPSPTINIESLSIASIDLSSLNLMVKLRVHNTSHQDVVVTSVSYEVKVMTHVIAGSLHQLEEFKAKQERIVDVPVALKHSSTSLMVLDALRSDSREIPYKITGSITIKGVKAMIPFEHIGVYTI